MTFANSDVLTPPDALIQGRGTVRVALEAARISRELGPRYSVGGLLGRGGFASVWEVFDGVASERLAAKRFESDAVRGTEFYREMSALFRLEHPNIVRIVNLLDVSDLTRYLFLEYCPGGTLRELLRETRREGRALPLKTLTRMAIELARGLSYAHRLDLIHRDLKPENILFAGSNRAGEPGVTKLADFGLVRAPRSGECAGLSRLSGTPAYLAPEQISGQFSPGSDLYALGVVLYEAFHGRPPFAGSPEEIALQHLNRPPEISQDIPSHWAEILNGLLEKDPARRPLEASWLIDRLEPSSRPPTDLRTEAPSIARCLGVEARSIVAEGDQGILALSSFGLFRFRNAMASRSGIVHQSASLARPTGDDGLWLASGSDLLKLGRGEAEARLSLRSSGPIDDLSPSNPGRSRVAVRSGQTISEYDAGGLEPRLVWSREIAENPPGSLARLADGRVLVAIGGESPGILILGDSGETTGTVELPGCVEGLVTSGDALLAKLIVDGRASAYRIDVERETAEVLPGAGELVGLAVDPADSSGIFGLFSSGAIVRWHPTGEPRNLGRFPEDEGPFLGLAVSGELLWALSARNDSTWLMARPIPRPD